MFIRRNRRIVKGEVYDYFTLVKTIQTAKGPRQQVVASLGKTPGLDRPTRQGWEQVTDRLEGHAPAPVQGELGKDFSQASTPQWAQVDLRGVRVERVRDFGQVYLALALWRRLGLHQLLKELMPPGREKVAWELTACILTVERFCGEKSELGVAERWYADSALVLASIVRLGDLGPGLGLQHRMGARVGRELPQQRLGFGFGPHPAQESGLEEFCLQVIGGGFQTVFDQSARLLHAMPSFMENRQLEIGIRDFPRAG